MEIFIFNLNWMTWNLLLGVFAVLFGYMMVRSTNPYFKGLWFFLWFLFVPNTIYVITDLYHSTYQVFSVQVWQLPILLLQYVILEVLGTILFLCALHYFDTFLVKLKISQSVRYVCLIFMNFLLSFGVMIGRFQRTNSWEVFTAPLKVKDDILAFLFSTDLLVYALLFGFLCNLLYFILIRRYNCFISYLKGRRDSFHAKKKHT
ncbi:MAG: DUF1361 domain-containing protein [Patescibacteria group bacterium]